MTENERLTDSNKEIPSLEHNEGFWLKVYFKLKDYEAISTIEEFKALKEKNEPKKAIFDNENEIYICSRCGKKVGEHQNYCWSCGQAFYT